MDRARALFPIFHSENFQIKTIELSSNIVRSKEAFCSLVRPCALIPIVFPLSFSGIASSAWDCQADDGWLLTWLTATTCDLAHLVFLSWESNDSLLFQISLENTKKHRRVTSFNQISFIHLTAGRRHFSSLQGWRLWKLPGRGGDTQWTIGRAGRFPGKVCIFPFSSYPCWLDPGPTSWIAQGPLNLLDWAGWIHIYLSWVKDGRLDDIRRWHYLWCLVCLYRPNASNWPTGQG